MPPEAETGYSTVAPLSPDAVTSKSGHVMESGSEKCTQLNRLKEI